jgi:hypothetical protein
LRRSTSTTTARRAWTISVSHTIAPSDWGAHFAPAGRIDYHELAACLIAVDYPTPPVAWTKTVVETTTAPDPPKQRSADFLAGSLSPAEVDAVCSEEQAS